MRPGRTLRTPAAAMHSARDASASQMHSACHWKTPYSLFGMLSTLLCFATSRARSPLVAELRTLATTYHKDPARLDQVREGLERVPRMVMRRICWH